MSNDTTDATTEDAEAKSAEQTEDTLLTQLQGDLEKFRDLALRSQADFENFRKRAAREKEDAIKYANASFLERLIPILDNFELGLNAARTSAADSPIFSGMDMVAKQLSDFLTSSGIEPVNAEGRPFDPNLHEAVAQEESAEFAEGVIIRQLRRGYKLRDRLLRPATVVVSKGAPSKK
jgi:molecular chaperone GrpE